MKNNTLKEILIILGLVFLGVTQTIYDIHISDFTDFIAPYNVPLRSSLLGPLCIYLIPFLALTLVYFLVKLINKKWIEKYLIFLAGISFTLLTLRILIL